MSGGTALQRCQGWSCFISTDSTREDYFDVGSFQYFFQYEAYNLLCHIDNFGFDVAYGKDTFGKLQNFQSVL